MNYHVIAQMSDGSQFDGIIESMDEDRVTMLVPEEVDEEEVNRQQFGYGNDDDGYDDYGRPRRRRFHRLFYLLEKNGQKCHRYNKKTVFDILGVVYDCTMSQRHKVA